jgi:hypothetical protein
MAPISKEYWEFNQSWLDYVKENWILDYSRVQRDKTNSPIITEFIERATSAFQDRGIPTNFVKAYISIQEPKESALLAVKDGYDDLYPHVHGQSNATTLIHYLQPGDKPAPLDIFEDGEVIETIYPEKGLTVFVPNDVWHGVRLNKGTTNRIQMIATAIT